MEQTTHTTLQATRQPQHCHTSKRDGHVEWSLECKLLGYVPQRDPQRLFRLGKRTTELPCIPSADTNIPTHTNHARIKGCYEEYRRWRAVPREREGGMGLSCHRCVLVAAAYGGWVELHSSHTGQRCPLSHDHTTMLSHASPFA